MNARTSLVTLTLLLATLSSANAKPKLSEGAQFQDWLVRYLKNEYRDDPDGQNLVYGYALVDLNGDGRNEAVVWSNDGNCGTSGCDLEVFIRKTSRWHLAATSSIGTRLPIKILGSSSRGW